MSRDWSRSSASFSDSDEEDESASFSDSEEEDESASFSDSATTSTNACGACPCCSKSEEIAELKQKLSFCESYQWQANMILRHQLGMNGSMIEIINGINLMFKQNNEMFKRYDEMFKRYDEMFKQNHKMFKWNHKMQQSMIQETRQLVMTNLLPPEQQPMQQQQPLQPSAAAAAATLQPQPQLGRTEEDEGEKNASGDLM